ncbi:hypothetical protein PPL_04114 [Heterostelium album PN500]|uniref:Uncharacterized protein n=1 Tax=Heterostelium pallidum (strain ATCC 26659 / Pp 5 / PN500) TaxID=670386 RepID=D3B624_HETP5|nr:hypothetical protein PPL_04114 [Heterostelium album PN500]EFA83322.1 hypothetical protein PPL_04114 [Heterostelium album PN500]|eukprot:XP_020435439.1 hypothetical protein PPL_04114 [Heterostelium album PN500]
MGGVQMEPREIEKITTLFNDISSLVKKNKIVDRDGFKRFHLIPGPLADRLFNLFDVKKTGMMTLDDFTQSLAVCGKAPEKDKLSLIFKFLDLDDDEVITKEEITVLSVVTLEGSSSPKIEANNNNGNGGNDDPMVSQLIDMGFSKLKALQAIKATDNGTKGATPEQSAIEVITNWLLVNQSKEDEIDIDESPVIAAVATPSPRAQSEKPDPKTLDELTAGLAISTILGTFEALFATIDKENTGKITVKQFKKWAQSSKRPQELDTLLKPIAGLFDRALKWKASGIKNSTETLEKSNSFSEDNNGVNPKELKRFSSLAVMETTTKNATLTKKDLQKEKDKELKEKELKEKEKEKELKKRESVGKLEKKDTQSEIVNQTTTTPKKDDTESARSSTFDSDFSDSDDDQPIKPVIQVVIREKPIGMPELKSESSLLNIDTTPGIVKPVGSQTLRARGTRASMRPAVSEVHDIFSSFQPLTPVPNSTNKSNTSTTTTTTTTTTTSAPSPTTTNSSSDSTTSSVHSTTLPESAKSTSKPGLEDMKLCIQYLERGEFTDAKIHIDKCIQDISHSQNGKNMKNEIIFCIGYRVAIGLLEKIESLESQLAEESNEDERSFLNEKLSLLSRFLVGIPLQSQHRAVCAKMAVKYNLDGKNYGIAAKFLEVLPMSTTNDDNNKRVLEQLALCRENKLVNESLPMYICAQCKSTGSLGDASLTRCSCGRPIRLCFSTFELIKGLSHLYCTFCQSTYNIEQTEVDASTECKICQLGRVEVSQ